MADYFIGRQQILDRDLRVYGYELLYRGGSVDFAEERQAADATNQIIVDAVLDYGLERIAGSRRAFINFTARNLIDKTPLSLPKERVVIEVLENIKVGHEVICAVADLSKSGYLIALDDFIFSEEWLPLVKLANIIKIDIRAHSPQQLAEIIYSLRPYDVKLLAEKVETYEEYDLYRALGFHYFQGFFFNKPNVIHGKRVDAASHSVAQLLALINKEEIDFKELAEAISNDVGLSYKLLRYINSAYFAFRKKIDSIQKAIIYLGMRQIKHWATILTLSRFSDKPNELLILSLSRAKMCELLAVLAGEKSEHFFLVGILSNLDAWLDAPMEEILNSLPLTDKVREAILYKKGAEGEALLCAIHYERCDSAAIRFKNLQPSAIRQAFWDSIQWTNDVTQHIR